MSLHCEPSRLKSKTAVEEMVPLQIWTHLGESCEKAKRVKLLCNLKQRDVDISSWNSLQTCRDQTQFKMQGRMSLLGKSDQETDSNMTIHSGMVRKHQMGWIDHWYILNINRFGLSTYRLCEGCSINKANSLGCGWLAFHYTTLPFQ